MLIVLGSYWLCIWQCSWRKLGFIPIIFGIISMCFSPLQPDFVFSPSAQQIAIRSSSEQLMMLPLKQDQWINRIWQEKLGVKQLSATQKKYWRQVINGQSVEQLPKLVCQRKKCIYDSAVTFDFFGHIWFDKQILPTMNGGYIYLVPQHKWQPLWPLNYCRPWHHCGV